MATVDAWINALLGRIWHRGTPVELEGALNFTAPLTATRNTGDGTIDVGLDDSDYASGADVQAAIEGALGTGVTGGQFPSPLPISVSDGPSAMVCPLGPSTDVAITELADSGTHVIEGVGFGFGVGKRCKVTVQVDATGEDGTAYELARRFIVLCGDSIVDAVTAYDIDHAIDGDVDAAWASEIAVTAAPFAGPGYAIELTVANGSGQVVNAIVTAQVETRVSPAAPTP
jgi:hypothetical protein